MSAFTETISSIASAVERIGSSKWLGVTVFSFLGIIAYTMFENRTTLFNILMANSWIGTPLSITIVVIVLAAIFDSFQKRVFTRYEAQLKQAEDEIKRSDIAYEHVLNDNKNLHSELIECKAGIHNTLARIEQVMRMRDPEAQNKRSSDDIR